MHEILVPRLNSNDLLVSLVEWLVPDGAAVRAGQPVAVLETSKAAEEIESAGDGYVRHGVAVGTDCAPGTVLGQVLPQDPSGAAAPDGGEAAPDGTAALDATAAPDGPVITRAAQQLADRHGLSPDALRATGRKIVKSEHVMALVGEEPAAAAPPGPERLQNQVAATVAASHRTIPTAFTVMKVDAEPLLAALDARGGGFAGIPTAVAAALASTRAAFPGCFSGLDDDGRRTERPGAQIGVTIDVGAGLFVPVLRDADGASVAELAAAMMRLRVQGLRGRFRARDLDGANIVLSINTEPGVLMARPIVFPGHACAVSLAALQEELRLDGQGRVVTGRHFGLGVAYDHRVVNGREAAEFLTAQRTWLEDPPVAPAEQ